MGRSPDIVNPFGDWSGWESREMDLIVRGRQPVAAPVRRNKARRVHGKARLTKEQAAVIKSLKGVVPTWAVAQEFGISKSHVRSIQSARRWAGV